MNEKNEAAEEDRKLKSLLHLWRAPHASRELDQRIFAAYLQKHPQSNKAPAAQFLKDKNEAISMKRCPTCQEEFAVKFSFCPVDGTPLNELAAAIVATPLPESASRFSRHDGGKAFAAAMMGDAFADGREFHLTIIEDQGIARRLASELREVAHESQLTWPEFRRDPIGFTKRSATAYGRMFRRSFLNPQALVATSAALLFVVTTVFGFIALDRYHAQRALLADKRRTDIELQEMVEIPKEEEKREEGAAGTNHGSGGGSKPKQEKPAGGGGGGRQETKPASMGKLPAASLTIPQVLAPDPNPPRIKNPSLPVVATIDADPLLFPPDTRQISYGDLRSKSTETSSGSGSGNGIGTGIGGGVGSGEGGGVGAGRGGNTGGGDRNEGGGGAGGGGGGVDYNRTFSPREVSQKARIISRPEPTYTEEARKNQVSGTVVLRAVFSAGGAVTNIRTVSGLPYGLTEKAIAAARQIKFSPAVKDGRAVSQYIEIQYNFNLY